MITSTAQPPATTASMAEEDSATSFSSLQTDIIEAHILPRLDGITLAATSCCSNTLRQISSQDHLWSKTCHSTWPSTRSPRVCQIISTYPDGGPSKFFSQAFPLLEEDDHSCSNVRPSSPSAPPPSELISAVDIHYQDKLIFSKVQETETVTGWFRCSPFRIDLLEPKDVVPTPIKHPEGDETCTSIFNSMTLSWILIDPIGRQAVNLSSHKPVTVQRHWLTGEVQMRFASILAVDSGHVQCGIVVTCSVSEEGDMMQIREICLEIEDMDGMHINGTGCLGILQRAMEGKKGKGRNRVQEGQRRYKEYLEMKKEIQDRKARTEGTLDTLCMALGVSCFLAFWCFILFR
ncbi:probable F-box At1g60180 [Olea europaea subsp. europaea]|uniref:Probable F-box At1g60180 n=1 Tax=Olea europaea subsp. europaea TaxID=158383 RepID=A0A8S0PVE1_OLEEU|nr:probable F-box At1g60180 [Olea europaea subsp. europaea]